MKLSSKVLVVTLAIFSVTACENMSRSQKNTAIGAAIGGAAGYALKGGTAATLGGAALGGVIGSQVGK